jgi:hypothetical protein
MKSRFLVVLLLLAVCCMALSAVGYARPREATYASTMDSTTTFSSIQVTGNDVAGNPGFIQLMSGGLQADGSGQQLYYLWIGNDGNLRLMSYGSSSGMTTLSTSCWTTGMGVVVGSQS